MLTEKEYTVKVKIPVSSIEGAKAALLENPEKLNDTKPALMLYALLLNPTGFFHCLGTLVVLQIAQDEIESEGKEETCLSE